MSVDPELLRGLRMSVEDAPENVALRLHLASVLITADEPTEALDHCAVVLARDPAHREALRVAALAAEAAEDGDRAAAYRALLAGLEGRSHLPAPVVAESESDVPVPADGPPTDEYDAFLREVIDNADLDVERPTVTLADVGGLEEVKRRLTTSFLGPMRNPELRKMYGTSLQGGLLLYGPPGCGKTFLARAVAGELGARFFAVGLHDVLDMWLGKSEQNLHAVFETARRHGPCVLFLDEVDALGLKRSHLSHSAGRNVVVQLLTELDSTRSDNRGLFVLGATNQPWDLDPALRRPGRFDRMLLVLPPDEAARRAIFEYHLRERPTHQIDTDRLAKRTDGYSGADIRLVCETAAENALEDSVVSGTPRPISSRDLDQALNEVKPSTRPWFESAKNYALFSNEDGTFDQLLTYMRKRRLG